MSIESAKAMVEKMKTDEDFSSRIAACKDAGELQELTEAEGFDVTKEDLAAIKETLTEEDLAQATGGTNAPTYAPWAQNSLNHAWTLLH